MSGDLFTTFVTAGVAEAAAMEDSVRALLPEDLPAGERARLLGELAQRGFTLGYQALLLGSEELGRLALAAERVAEGMRTAAAPPTALPVLASGLATLRAALEQLAQPDRSGARVEGLPLRAATLELEACVAATPGRPAAPVIDVPAASLRKAPTAITSPSPTTSPSPSPSTTTSTSTLTLTGTGTGEALVWVPSVDDDMVELFFEEVKERIEELSVKLLGLEQRPQDAELLRDIFRDLHTVKGSSAMVGLTPANRLAHAAEDLAGQLRDGSRVADSKVVDVLLATLDGLREIMRKAQARQPIDVDFAPLVQRLRDPSAAPVPGATLAAAPPVPAATADDDDHPERSRATAPTGRDPRPTIRVDFDKLDRLMNLVGELVLGRDGLRHAIQSLGAVSGELGADRILTRKALQSRRLAAGDLARPVAEDGGEAARTVLGQLGDELGRVERVLDEIGQELDYSTGRLDTISGDLRDQVMKLRMVPIGGVFRKHHRTVRDLASSLGKKAVLQLQGEDTELDKLLVEALDEPLMHLVRNAVDHGVEPPDRRQAAGKPAEGTIRLSASHRGNQMVIQIRDDGNGIDPAFLRRRARERNLLTAAELDSFDDRQILEVIFRPGFSTAEKVSEVSGRGVGMDVVRQTIVSRLKGTIDIDSRPGAGTTFTLRLPLTLAIIQVLLARAGGEVLAVPLDPVVRTFTARRDDVQWIEDRETIAVRDRQIPLIRLAELLELDADAPADEQMHVILTEVGSELYGLACDHLLGKKEIVIKSLGDLLQTVPCAAGATLLGDRCAIILDVPALIARALQRGAPRRAAAAAAAAPAGADAPSILIVEDSDTVRESLRRLLAGAGYRVTVAVDGVEAMELCGRQRFDLISTDVMMPRMDGYELTRALRATPEYRDTPIVMVTSRGERIDRVRGFDAGVDEYITKPHDRALLVRVVRKLLGAAEEDA